MNLPMLLLLLSCDCAYDPEEASRERLEAYCTRAAACVDGDDSVVEQCLEQNADWAFPDDCEMDGCAVRDCVARYQDDPGCANGLMFWIPPECGLATCQDGAP